MYENICTLPLTSDLFAQAIHPTAPLLTVGLSSGHVQCFRLPAVASDSNEDDNDESALSAKASENGYGQIETAWRTRRHKGSCRSLGFSVDGEHLFSAGTDGLVKVACAETGVVGSKIAVPLDPTTDEIDAPSLLHVLSPQSFLLATDSAALHLYDLRLNSSFKGSTPQATHHPHEDYISSLTPLPPSDASTSGFSKQWVSTGGTTLAVTDLRRGVLVRSEDQEEELLSTAFVSGLSKKGTSTGEKILVGGASGVITLWERGIWDDQDERIVLDRTPGGGESVDCIVNVPESRLIVAGMGNGLLAFVQMGSNKIVEALRHDELEGVVGLGFDAGGRMISGGGQIVKVWREGLEDEGEVASASAVKRAHESGDSDGSDAESESKEEEQPEEKRRKGKKRKGKGVNGVKTSPAMFKGLD